MSIQTQAPPPQISSSSLYSQPPPGSAVVPPAALNTGVQPVFSANVLGAIPAPGTLPPPPGSSAALSQSQPPPPQSSQPPPPLLTNRPPPGFPGAPAPPQTNVPPPNLSAPPPVPVPRPLFSPPGTSFATASTHMPNVNVPPPNFAPPVFHTPLTEYEPTPAANLPVPDVSCPYPEAPRAVHTPRGRGQRGGRGARPRAYGRFCFSDVVLLYIMPLNSYVRMVAHLMDIVAYLIV